MLALIGRKLTHVLKAMISSSDLSLQTISLYGIIPTFLHVFVLSLLVLTPFLVIYFLYK